MIITLATFSLVHAAPLNMWGGAQAKNTATVMATAYSSLEGAVAPTLYGGVGLANGDVWTGFGLIGDLTGGAPTYSIDVMPRWFVSDSLAFCPRVSHVGGDATMVGVEVHHVASAGRFVLTSNVGWHPSLSIDGFSTGDVVLLMGPELFFTERLSFAAEVDVSTPVSNASRTSAAVAPALSAVFDRAGTQSAAIGAIVPVWPETGSPRMGAWYSVVFGTSRHGVAADAE